VRESLPGAGVANIPSWGAKSASSSPSILRLGWSCAVPYLQNPVLAKRGVRAHTRQIHHPRPQHQIFASRPRLCRPTTRRQLTCSHGPVSTHCTWCRWDAFNWEHVNTGDLRERTSDTKAMVPHTDRRPLCDHTLRRRKSSAVPPWADERDGRCRWLKEDVRRGHLDMCIPFASRILLAHHFLQIFLRWTYNTSARQLRLFRSTCTQQLGRHILDTTNAFKSLARSANHLPNMRQSNALIRI
jgi:hypothetical protein